MNCHTVIWGFNVHYVSALDLHDIPLPQIRQWLRQWLVAWRTKPLTEPMLTCHQWSTLTITWGQFCKRYPSHQLTILAWKLLIQKPDSNLTGTSELKRSLKTYRINCFDSGANFVRFFVANLWILFVFGSPVTLSQQDNFQAESIHENVLKMVISLTINAMYERIIV